jgi:o-succinylbenzoate---CoA ligase
VPFGRGDAWLASLPMYHVGGFSLIMRALIDGGRIVFPQAGERLADSIMRPDITHLSLVPTQLLRLLDQPECVNRLKRVKTILLGGDAIPARLIERAAALELPVCISYGCTEAASQVATSAPGRPADGAKVLPHCELKIGADGEMCIRGKTLFAGYVQGDSVDPARDAEGWFHTGDIGSIDENGTLRVSGRKDRMFVSSGENIHPEEIERALIGIENIEQAFVFPVKDPQFTNRPAAFVRTRDNRSIDTEAITAELKRQLEPFKIPRTFHPWPETARDTWKMSRQPG